MTAVAIQDITARSAAYHFARELKPLAAAMGYNPKDIVVQSPSRAEFGGWTVAWEGGPHEWAVCASLGGSIMASELESYQAREPEFGLFPWHRNWHTEPGYSFTLSFYQDKS